MSIIGTIQIAAVLIAGVGTGVVWSLFPKFDPKLVGRANAQMARLHSDGISIPRVLGILERARISLLGLWVACLFMEYMKDPTDYGLIVIGVMAIFGMSFLLLQSFSRIREFDADDSTYDTESTQKRYAIRAYVHFSMSGWRQFELVMMFFVLPLAVLEITSGGPSTSSALLLIIMVDSVIAYFSCTLPGRRGTGKKKAESWGDALPEGAP